MLITIYIAETNLFNWLHHALAVVIEGEVGAVRPLLPAQFCTLGGDAAQIQRHLAARSAEVSCGLLEGEDAAIAGAPGAHLHFVGGVPLLLLTLSR